MRAALDHFSKPRRPLRALGVAVALVCWAGYSLADIGTLTTVTGGRVASHGPDSGFVDGDLVSTAQFNTPAGIVVRASGDVVLADTGNLAVRRLQIGGNSSTLIRNLSKPVAVAVDASDNLYVLVQGTGANGQILRYDRYDNLYQFPVTVNAVGLANPTGFALDAGTNIFVVELGGDVKRIPLTNGIPSTIVSGLKQPGGIAILDSGLLAITETGLNVVRFVNPADGKIQQTIGVPKTSITDGIYFRDGPGNQARFNQPLGIAHAPNNSLVVADRMNHRVRLITVDGVVTTLYGVDPSLWPDECLSCNPLVLPGWYDGLNGNPLEAESREPSGVTVSSAGQLYVTEQYYHIIRSLTGSSSVAPGSGGGGGSGTNALVVLPPVVTPDAGYHPMGVVLTVVNPNTNSFFKNVVYYTTDGSDPGTNSLSVNLTNGVGTIVWRDAANSLASLRLRAFAGSVASDVVQGRRGAKTELGVPRDLTAGMGSTVLVPIVLNLQDGTTNVVRSLQFRVEFKPLNGAPTISDRLSALPISTNDFVRVSGPASDKPAVGQFATYPTGLNKEIRGIYAAFIGTNANFLVSSHAVVTMLSVPIPANAVAGQGYEIGIFDPSGTTDGAETAIEIAAMPKRTLTVKEVSYVVGDSSPAVWYNAESSGLSTDASLGFGNGNLQNSDVNNAFAMAMGTRKLPPGTDLFDAMDAYPVDTTTRAGGDGQIRFLDWQYILQRALRLDAQNWRRTWTANGVRKATTTTLSTNVGDSPVVTFDTTLRATPWNPSGQLMAGFKDWMEPGSTALIPVSVNMLNGNRLAGMQFRVSVQPRGGTPPLILPVHFSPNLGRVGMPTFAPNMPPTDIGAAWDLAGSSFSPALTGQTLLGTLEVTIPDAVRPGDVYDVVFSHSSGAPDFSMEYDFELANGALYAGAAAPESNPTKLLHGIKLNWFGAMGARYNVEASGDLQHWDRIASDLTGTGRDLEYIDTGTTSAIRFYRVVGQP